MKERVQPKMGKIDIDYQVLHDAFFKYQSKPTMTGHGDTYYEGKEFEVRTSTPSAPPHLHPFPPRPTPPPRTAPTPTPPPPRPPQVSLREKKPGVVTDDLRKALGMEVGGAPPWLINMQRYGPPPSYPNLKIPGLNAPIPEGATYGFHPGGWGKPPVDEFGRPLYGDVFGTAEPEPEDAVEAPAPRELWGAMGDEDDEEEEDESEEEEDGDDQSALGEDEISAGISSVSSVPSGLATPDQINLRKETGGGLATPLSSSGVDTPDSVAHGAPPSQQQLYQVISQREAKVGGAAFGSAHTYNLPGQGSGGKPASGKPGGVELALDPSELEKLDEGALKARYDAQRRADREATAPEDVSDILAEHERKRRRKDDAKSARGY